MGRRFDPPVHRKVPGLKRFALTGLVVLISLADPFFASAQSFGPNKKPGSVEGSPLDTIMSTRIWTTPPEAKDFVRQSRPDPGSLDYTPLHGTDPKRAKPRDAANVLALQAELEHDIRTNKKRAQALGGVTKPDPSRTAQKKHAATSER